MDSCSSSPSHSFKDRPRSLHCEISRQSSFPHSLDKTKSPASKGVVENRDTARDLARRAGYAACGAEKDGGDALLSSPERSRNSLRKPFGFERAERHGDSKAELHRSARSRTPLRNLERDSIETGGRLVSRRSSHGGDGHHKADVSEGLSRSLLHGGASKRGCDRESGEIKHRASSSPEMDGEASRSPPSGKGVGIMRYDGKDVLKGSSRTSVTCSTKRDLGTETRTPRTSPSMKDGTEKRKLSSAIKASEREKLDEKDGSLLKTKPHAAVKEKETQQDQEACSSETEGNLCNKDFSIRPRSGGGDDASEDEQGVKAKDSQDDRSPPVSFLHISKKARSDRDRGRRDEHAIRASVQHTQGNDTAMAERHKEGHENRLDFGTAAKKTDELDAESGAMFEASRNEASGGARSVDSGPIRANDRSCEKVEIEGSGDRSDMEEGELEPELEPGSQAELGRSSFTDEKTRDSKEMEEVEKQNCAVLSLETEGMENCDGIIKAGMGKDKSLNLPHGDGTPTKEDDINDKHVSKHGHMMSLDKAENQQVPLETEDKVDLGFNVNSAPVPMTKAMDLGESSNTGSTFDLLGSRTEPKSWDALPADRGSDMNKELTLSLFTKPSDLGGSTQGRRDTRIQGSNGKQTTSIHDLDEGFLRSNVGGSGEESSQHSGHKQKKLKMESLQLSLALPGTSNVGMDSNPLHPVADPERSFQSLSHTQTHTQNPANSLTYTNSDGFTASFSQSESFLHNPSCSLNCTSLENQELSCGGSMQLSQGTEQMSARSWSALSGNEQQMSNGMHTVTSVSHDKSKHRRSIPLYQRVLQNGSMHQGFPSVTGSNRSSGSNHVSQRSHHFGQRLQEAPRILDSSSQDLEGSGKHINTSKDIMERVRQQKAWFASKQQAMSSEARPEPNASQGRDKLTEPPVKKGPTVMGYEMGGGDKNGIGLYEITTEPIAAMAQKLQELPDSILEGLKGVAKEVLGSFEKRDEFIGLQDNIRRRTDLSEDSLLRAHRTQLEILVALKTGLQAFVQEGSKQQTYKALIEIFLQTKCRNVACQQQVPVCGCECRICSKKNGFCHECMCVVCSKFDSDNNTCRWVGCDVCLHWCHTDCGLRNSFIAPASTPKNANGTTEMQYHCVACDHKSELFGFVKEVFHKCAETWAAETLAKELDCVRRIFHGSEDMRGKQLCWKAEQMLQKLENNVDAAEVCRSMLRFFQEGNAELDGACGPNKKASSSKANDASGRTADLPLPKEGIPKARSSGGSQLLELDNARVVANFDRNLEVKRTEAPELSLNRARQRAEIEDIESVVRIKQAEAEMFQVRAVEAQQEAGGLQRIISVKRVKIEEDYECKYAKLRLSEAEERRQKRYEELRALEGAQRDFQKMKLRMEAEMKELMVKVEVGKRQFP